MSELLQMESPQPAQRSLDRRSVRTRASLRRALAAEIVAAGDLSQVTVTAVTDRAGVTRRTFYSHYRDIPDLVDRIERDCIVELSGYVAAISAVHLTELESAISRFDACPGVEELLNYFKTRGSHLGALLGEGGDPAFAEKIMRMVRDVVTPRAAEGLDLEVLGPIFDYYLTYAISAETGVLVRWLTGGMKEPVGTMARVMTALMFVRPGDLYGRTIDFKIPDAALELIRIKGEKHD
ncbi:TetR/AcrR family transcriptional regulator [Olsenella urininfantis]|uniref:TetR/AcrR family transcriptional regulator n=1 Tax=Olsenella urininfantis TaxID=1871033 RepID=UPI0009844107|nr:TetR/AcrR family transcriptional regulator [Olsenella urininfantis]